MAGCDYIPHTLHEGRVFCIDFLLQNHKYQVNGTGVLLYIAAKLFIFIIKKLMLMLVNSIKKRMKEFLKEFAIGL